MMLTRIIFFGKKEIELETFKTYKDLKKHVKGLFPQANNLIFKYKDEEDDWIKFSDEKEYTYLQEYHRNLKLEKITIYVDDPEYIKKQTEIQRNYKLARMQKELMMKRMKMQQMINMRMKMMQMNNPCFFSSFCKSRTNKCPNCKGKEICKCGKFGDFCTDFYKQDNPFINAGDDQNPIQKAFSILFKKKECQKKCNLKHFSPIQKEIHNTEQPKINENSTTNNTQKEKTEPQRPSNEQQHQEIEQQIKEITDKLRQEGECVIKLVLKNFFDGDHGKVRDSLKYIYELKGLKFDVERFDKKVKICEKQEAEIRRMKLLNNKNQKM